MTPEEWKAKWKRMTPEERTAEWERIPSQEEIDEAIERARCPVLYLNKTKFPDDPGEPGCWLGGEPTLPPEFDWPYHEVDGIRCPLHFIAQVNLERVPRDVGYPDLPTRGTLYFFVDTVFSTSASKVLYFDGDASKFDERHMPPFPEASIFKDELNEDFLNEMIAIPNRWNFDWIIHYTFSYSKQRTNYTQSVIRKKQLISRRFAANEMNNRRIAGEEGASIKNTLHHFFGGPEELSPPEDNLILLFRFLEDDDIGVDRDYRFLFWIPAESLKNREFDKVLLTTE